MGGSAASITERFAAEVVLIKIFREPSDGFPSRVTTVPSDPREAIGFWPVFSPWLGLGHRTLQTRRASIQSSRRCVASNWAALGSSTGSTTSPTSIGPYRVAVIWLPSPLWL